MAVRHLADQAFAASAPASQRRHVGLGPRLIDEDETRRINSRLIFFPLRPPPCNVRPILFAGHRGFF
jgi:hypothetical protein